MLGKKIKKLREKRQQLMDRGHRTPPSKLLAISREIEKTVEKESTHWQQRARMNWLREGDRNSGVFHAQASERRRKNTIKELFDDHGQRQTTEQAKARVISSYFEKLYQTSSPTAQDINSVVSNVQEHITTDQCSMLEEKFTEDEVKRAVFELHPAKSPGPDGFTGRFFQNTWGISNEGDTTSD